MAYSTALDGPGVFSLGQVQLFFKKIKLDLSEVEIKQDYFDRNLYRKGSAENQRFHDFVTSSKLCPVIGAMRKIPGINEWETHAMVVDKAIPNGSDWYFQCKNTFKSNPQVFVGHASHQSIVWKTYDAIIISFARK